METRVTDSLRSASLKPPIPIHPNFEPLPSIDNKLNSTSVRSETPAPSEFGKLRTKIDGDEHGNYTEFVG